MNKFLFQRYPVVDKTVRRLLLSVKLQTSEVLNKETCYSYHMVFVGSIQIKWSLPQTQKALIRVLTSYLEYSLVEMLQHLQITRCYPDTGFFYKCFKWYLLPLLFDTDRFQDLYHFSRRHSQILSNLCRDKISFPELKKVCFSGVIREVFSTDKRPMTLTFFSIDSQWKYHINFCSKALANWKYATRFVNAE